MRLMNTAMTITMNRKKKANITMKKVLSHKKAHTMAAC